MGKRTQNAPARLLETSYLTSIAQVVTPERWARIVEKAAKDAEEGNEKARAWLATYLVGRPGADAPLLSKVEDVEHRVATARRFRI